MNKIKQLIAATLVGGLLCSTAFAATTAGKSDLPRPEVVVNPTNLPIDFKNTVVKLSLTIDEHGQPHNIKLISPADRKLARQLVPVIAQWRFTAPTENGVPVSKQVVLPLDITVES